MIMMPLGPILIKAFGIGTHEFGLLVASYSFSAGISGLLAATFILKTAVATPLMLRYTLLRKALSTNGVVTVLVRSRSP